MSAMAPTAGELHPIVVLVHGAWHGAWCWAGLQDELTKFGYVSQALDLPSADPTRSPPASMYEDAEVISEVLAQIDGPVLLVAHSYGGLPATQAAVTAENVIRLVYVAAFRVRTGESLSSVSGMPKREDGHMPVPARPTERFYNDLPDERAEQLVARLVPQSSRSFTDPLTHGAEEVTAASYVICEQDQVFPVAWQERMAADIDSVRMPTGHSPFLADPAGLARVLAEMAR